MRGAVTCEACEASAQAVDVFGAVPGGEEQEGEGVMRVGWNRDRDVEGFVVPLWLGVADHDYSTRRVLMLPIPANFIYAFGMWTWLHVKFPRFQDEIERRVASKLSSEHRRGFEEGFEEGFEAGEKSGRDKQKFEMRRFFDKSLAEMRAGSGASEE